MEPGRRIQQLKLFVVVPLTVLGLTLGIMLLNNSGDLTQVPELSASAVASAGAAGARAAPPAAGGSAHKPTMEEVMQTKVKECAKKLTGDDTPRKLDEKVRAQVLECASDIMPAMDTKALLKASADKLRAAAKDAGKDSEKEAEEVIHKVETHEEAAPNAKPSPPKQA